MKALNLKSHYVLYIALLILWSAIFYLLFSSLSITNGHFIYLLDDPYIHMATARQFLEHGVWGVTQYGFTSSSSSILWPILLVVLYALFGVNTLTPFVLNIVLASASLIVIYSIFRAYRVPAPLNLVLLVLITFIAPMPTLVFTGLEHLLHIFCTLLFIYFAPRALVSAINPQTPFFSGDMKWLLVSSTLMCMSRYEGLFMLFVVCLLFALRLKLAHALVLGITSVAPLVLYGLISVVFGSNFLPNSILLKSALSNAPLTGAASDLLRTLGIRQVLDYDYFFMLLAIALIALLGSYLLSKQLWTQASLMLIIFIAGTFLHARFAQANIFFRYEAYLLAVGSVVIPCSLMMMLDARPQALTPQNSRLRTILPATFALILLLPTFSLRGWGAFVVTPPTTSGIYQQQYQMASFLHEYYNDQSVAANDIGYITYNTDINLLDLWGLASTEIANAKLQGTYNPDLISKFAAQHNVKIAAAYPEWFESYGGFPQTWRKVGTWTSSVQYTLAYKTVTFYAVDPNEEDRLRANLTAFSSQLPPTVQVNLATASEGSLAP